MSWIFNEDRTALINLDKIESIEVLQVDGSDDYCLVAQFQNGGDDDSGVWLLRGDRSQCLVRLEQIAAKVHMVRV